MDMPLYGTEPYGQASANMQVDYPEVILASASAARAAILGNAGLRFHQRPSSLDEFSERKALASPVPAADVAVYLASRKAEVVALDEPGAVVIGADQVLSFEGEIFQKAQTEAEAREHLMRMRGKTHELHSAAVILFKGVKTVFLDKATLTMRDYSDEFLDWYLETASETVLTSVGGYHIEGLGIHLFSKISGDYFTILGMPITPLLDELRRLKILLP
jgi:septum formation protein